MGPKSIIRYYKFHKFQRPITSNMKMLQEAPVAILRQRLLSWIRYTRSSRKVRKLYSWRNYLLGLAGWGKRLNDSDYSKYDSICCKKGVHG